MSLVGKPFGRLDAIDERWEGLIGCEDLYEVSSFGRVRSMVGKNGLPVKEWRECTLSEHPKGYVQVSIKGKLRLVQDLVLTAFVGPRKEGQQACHFPDPAKTNNHLNNLRWGTRSDNAQDMALQKKVKGQKLSPEQALEILNEVKGKRLMPDLLADLRQRFPDVTESAFKNIKYRQTWRCLDRFEQ